jgi:AAA15 family ATPase/GTPase
MSFKDETEFNMLPAKGNGSRQLSNHIIKTDSGIEILKTAAIYGANAAGKSNLVKALRYLRRLITTEQTLLVPQSMRFRLNPEYKNKSTIFKIEYLYKNFHFDYAVEISKSKIVEEWLYLINSVPKNKEQLLYKRSNNTVEFGDYFESAKDLNYAEIFIKKEIKDTETVANTLFGVFEDKPILSVFCEAFSKLHIVTPESFNIDYTQSILLGTKSISFAKDLLVQSKTGISDIILKKENADFFFGHDESDFKSSLIDKLESKIEQNTETSKHPSIIFPYGKYYYAFIKEKNDYKVLILTTFHNNISDVSFDFDEESDGTNRLFQLSPAFEELINDDDVTYVIDELERSMHPVLAKQLLKLYSLNSKSRSQLIFTTHESNLLDDDLLRRDEIWFGEKKENGSTEFYPLSNFNPRGDKIIERGYLQGRYGGIPYLGDFSKLFVEENQEK